MTHPEWNIGNMKTTAWVLQTQALSRLAGDIYALAARCRSEGPFFDRTMTEMRDVSRSLGNAGDALNRLGGRLLRLAEEEEARRAFDSPLGPDWLRD